MKGGGAFVDRRSYWKGRIGATVLSFAKYSMVPFPRYSGNPQNRPIGWPQERIPVP